MTGHLGRVHGDNLLVGAYIGALAQVHTQVSLASCGDVRLLGGPAAGSSGLASRLSAGWAAGAPESKSPVTLWWT